MTTLDLQNPVALRPYRQAYVRKRKRPDWEAVERDYRTGAFSLRELGVRHGVTHSAIAAKVKQHGWTADLSRAVKAATRAKLIEADVARAVDEGRQSTTAAVLAAAEVAKQVILQHRRDIAEARALTNSLMAELQAATLNRCELEALLAVAGPGLDAAEAAAVRAQAMRLLSLHARVSSMERLATAMTRLQQLERRAFGLAEDGKADEGDALSHYTEAQLEAEARRLRERLEALPGGSNVVRMPVRG